MTLAAAALLLLLAGGLLLIRRSSLAPRPSAAQPPPAATPDAGCGLPDAVLAPVMPGAEAPPVILWAAGSTRISVDGSPAFSDPDAPKTLNTGVHTLRVDADGAHPFQTRFRVDAFTPALFHAQLDPGVGITVARLGSVCASCDVPVDEVRLEPEASTEPVEALLAAAAAALRTDDWRTAAAKLRGVPPRARTGPLFHRLAAGLYEAVAQPDPARAELAALDDAGSNGLRPLLPRLDALAKAERGREREVVLARWNRMTERYGRLVQRFERVVPGAVSGSAARMAELSKAFAEASRQGDAPGMEGAQLAADDALAALALQLRASRALDCVFQADVVQALVR